MLCCRCRAVRVPCAREQPDRYSASAFSSGPLEKVVAQPPSSLSGQVEGGPTGETPKLTGLTDGSPVKASGRLADAGAEDDDTTPVWRLAWRHRFGRHRNCLSGQPVPPYASGRQKKCSEGGIDRNAGEDRPPAASIRHSLSALGHGVDEDVGRQQALDVELAAGGWPVDLAAGLQRVAIPALEAVGPGRPQLALLRTSSLNHPPADGPLTAIRRRRVSSLLSVSTQFLRTGRSAVIRGDLRGISYRLMPAAAWRFEPVTPSYSPHGWSIEPCATTARETESTPVRGCGLQPTATDRSARRRLCAWVGGKTNRLSESLDV